MFLVLIVAGLAGLVAMALPAFGKHASGAHVLHAGHVAKLAPGRGAIMTTAAATTALAKVSGTTAATVTAGTSWMRFLPSPRTIFSSLALYGAFGNVLLAAHLGFAWAALAAVVPAAIVERFAVLPLWRLMFRFQGQPSTPLTEVVMCEATAVTAFRRGRGMVSVVRDGRRVQFSARLVEAQVGLAVQVGDRLRVEDVDPERERLTVSMLKAG
jgi:hypothetical protein